MTPILDSGALPGAVATAPLAGAIPGVRLLDCAPPREDFAAAVLAGLRRPRKALPCKFLYDARGCWLFERICELPEYYPTRTELAILRQHAAEIATALGPDCLLVEYGSGSSLKTRILLDHLQHPAGYVPIDIARPHLLRAAAALAAAYPGLEVLPVCADYTGPFRLPTPRLPPARTVVFFPGSTVGNFEPAEARAFLQAVRQRSGPDSGLLIGVDLRKDPRVLHAAYNDAAGITAAFNLNLLARINRELPAGFGLDRFVHYACYHARHGRIEMHLVSLTDQAVRVAGAPIAFAAGESIFTEASYKYTLDGFAELARSSGYQLRQVWTDDARHFSVQYLVSGCTLPPRGHGTTA